MRSGSIRLVCRTTALLVTATGCMRMHPPPSVSVDPDVTFALHRGRDGFGVDRLPGGKTGVVTPFGWSLRATRPTFLLESDGATLAAFWLPGPSQVVVRRTPAAEAAPLGTIDPSWGDDAIRLALAPPEGPALQSEVFARQGGGTGPSALSRTAQTNLDVRGTYRAVLHDPKGAPVGWLRVRMGPYQVFSRIYDGVLPAAGDPALGIAAALALDAEIDWIENHVTNVYPGGNLEQSFPMGR